MHVIGHDDEITESIANSVEMVQCIGDNASDLRTFRDTRTVTIIKKTFVRLPELSLERVFEFLFQGVGNRFPVQRCGLGWPARCSQSTRSRSHRSITTAGMESASRKVMNTIAPACDQCGLQRS